LTAQVPTAPAVTNKIVIDSSVVVRIIKHSVEQYPAQATGQLLGFEDSETLSINNCFPLPNSANDNEGAGLRSKAILKYQSDMISHLKEVNVDANSIGFYASANLGKFFSQNVLDNLLSYQIQNPESVLLVHDVSRHLHSGLALHAYRLSPAYLTVRKEGKFSSAQLTKHELSYHNIFQEIPIEIKNSHLVTLYLHSIQPQEEDYQQLDISIDSYLEKNIETMFEAIDEFHYDQSNYNYYQRHLAREKGKLQQWQMKRKSDNLTRQANGETPLSLDEGKNLFKLPEEPSRLDNLLISGQIAQFCNQMEEFGSTVGPKLFAVQKVLD
jgi:translation initiation factor 3 subunit H